MLQGDGVPPPEARAFCEWIDGDTAPRLDGTHFSVCALGDTSYTHFCACGKRLDARLAELGAHRVVQRRDVNKEDYKAVDAWLDAVCGSLPLLPLKSVIELGGATLSSGLHAS